MRVWVAIWTGSGLLCGQIGAWIAGGPVPRLIALLLAAGFAKGLPWTTVIAWTTGAAWLAYAILLGLRAPAVPEQPTEEAPQTPALTPEKVTAAMHELAAPHVQLVPLAEALESTTADLREVLKEMGVPVAGGVRMKGRGVSPGVRSADLPPLSPAAAIGTGGALTSDNNSNNSEEGAARKRLGGRHKFWVTDDPKNPARAHVHHP